MNFVLGDRILEINGHSLEGLSRQEVKYVKNPPVDARRRLQFLYLNTLVRGLIQVFFSWGAPLRKSVTGGVKKF